MTAGSWSRLRLGLVVYGTLNSILYVSLLPLWEGFDEPFHYGYVAELSRRRAIPRLGLTALPEDVCQSLRIAPASHVVRHNLPFVTTFDEYFRLSDSQRAERRRALSRLLPESEKGACGGNYEAQQAPLAYLTLAPVDSIVARWSLPVRVWLLRVICALFASLASTWLLFRLARGLGIDSSSADVAVFVMLSAQMFYATAAHIANDWLAIPLMILFFERLVSAHDRPGTSTVCSLAAALGLGLLTKSYFPAVLPVAVWLVSVHAFKGRIRWTAAALFGAIVGGLAGSWYLRNVLYYGNVAGIQELSHGITWREFLSSAANLPWGRSIVDLCFASLWTGNNSDVSFSRTTLLLFVAVVAALLAIRLLRRRVEGSEWLVISGCGLYIAALLYSTAVSYWATKGVALRTASWYTQPIVPVVMLIAVSAAARRSTVTATLARSLVAISFYILVLTYWIKLIPLYGGYTGRATLPRVLEWYRGQLPGGMEILSATALVGNTAVILGLTAATTAVSALLAALVFVRSVRGTGQN